MELPLTVHLQTLQQFLTHRTLNRQPKDETYILHRQTYLLAMSCAPSSCQRVKLMTARMSTQALHNQLSDTSQLVDNCRCVYMTQIALDVVMNSWKYWGFLWIAARLIALSVGGMLGKQVSRRHIQLALSRSSPLLKHHVFFNDFLASHSSLRSVKFHGSKSSHQRFTATLSGASTLYQEAITMPGSVSSDGAQSTRTSQRSENSDPDPFQPILHAIDFQALCAKAEALREVLCTVDKQPKLGAFNAVFTIEFEDGVRWIARVPGRGLTDFGPLHAERMASDSRIKNFIRSKTAIPIPEVFTVVTTAENPVRVPYSLEAFAEGTKVLDIWDDLSEDHRLLILRNLARTIAPLATMNFEKIGTPQIDETGNIVGMGPLIVEDNDLHEFFCEERVWFKTVTAGPFDTTYDKIVNEVGPLKARGGKLSPFRQAMDSIHQVAISSLPKHFDSRGFFLHHPDFDCQNIFVDEAGDITAIIDWDGVATTSPVLGAAQFPLWLMLDWVPPHYDYGRDGTDGDDSPEQLFRYRQEYAAAFRAAQSAFTPEDTLFSPIVHALLDVCLNETSGPLTELSVMNWAFKNASFDGKAYVEAYKEGRAKLLTAELQKAFEGMWRPEVGPWIFGDRADLDFYRSGFCALDHHTDEDRKQLAQRASSLDCRGLPRTPQSSPPASPPEDSKSVRSNLENTRDEVVPEAMEDSLKAASAAGTQPADSVKAKSHLEQALNLAAKTRDNLKQVADGLANGVDLRTAKAQEKLELSANGSFGDNDDSTPKNPASLKLDLQAFIVRDKETVAKGMLMVVGRAKDDGAWLNVDVEGLRRVALRYVLDKGHSQ